MPQLAPSVTRVQTWLSVAFAGAQVPLPLHAWSVRVRVWVPMVEQVLAIELQVPHVVYVVWPQETPASARALPGQSGEEPVQRSSTSQPLAAVRQTREAPSSAQVPLVAAPEATLQASQVPAQALSQHTPSTQKVDRHSPAAPQGVPGGFFAAQYMPLQ